MLPQKFNAEKYIFFPHIKFLVPTFSVLCDLDTMKLAKGQNIENMVFALCCPSAYLSYFNSFLFKNGYRRIKQLIWISSVNGLCLCKNIVIVQLHSGIETLDFQQNCKFLANGCVSYEIQICFLSFYSPMAHTSYHTLSREKYIGIVFTVLTCNAFHNIDWVLVDC